MMNVLHVGASRTPKVSYCLPFHFNKCECSAFWRTMQSIRTSRKRECRQYSTLGVAMRQSAEHSSLSDTWVRQNAEHSPFSKLKVQRVLHFGGWRCAAKRSHLARRCPHLLRVSRHPNKKSRTRVRPLQNCQCQLTSESFASPDAQPCGDASPRDAA